MKFWFIRLSITWSLFWIAFGLGCITRGQGNATIHVVTAALHIPFVVFYVVQLYRLNREESPNET